jgi:4-alpha-glucanotransferase
MTTDALRRAGAACGIVPSYTDQTAAAADAAALDAALLAALGLPVATEAEAAETLAALRGGGGAPPAALRRGGDGRAAAGLIVPEGRPGPCAGGWRHAGGRGDTLPALPLGCMTSRWARRSAR